MAIGQKQAARFPELGVGTTFKYGRRTWTIVGIFADRGSALESEFWTDIDVLQQDARFENGYSSFHVVLKPGTEETFRNALNEDARLTVDAISEKDFFAEQAKVADRLRELVLIVGLIVGNRRGLRRHEHDVCGGRAAHARSGSVAHAGLQPRIGADELYRRERDSGAGRRGHRRSARDSSSDVAGLDNRLMSVGAVVFSSAFSVSALAAGIAAALLIGIVGGLMPAWRASRLPIVESLREA